MGGQKALQTNKQRTNKRTPQTIIRPRQDSQNPRANNKISKVFIEKKDHLQNQRSFQSITFTFVIVVKKICQRLLSRAILTTV